MRSPWIILAAATLVGCATQTKPDIKDGKSTATASLTLPANPRAAASAANAEDMPIPPKDAQYTIYCEQFSGSDHLERSRYVRQLLHDKTTMKDWYMVHGADESTLYYGFYPTFDRKEPKRAKDAEKALNDLDAVRAMVDANGFRPFSSSLPVPIDSPDPSENPAWDLSRSDKYWSLQVAAYKDSAERKHAAVEVVADMRAHGIEAYYFHGSTVSSVCIGAWPQQAVRESETSDQNTDPNQQLMVTSQALDPKMQEDIENKTGMKNVAPTVEVIDPTLIATMRQYPEHAVNGQVLGHRVNDPATGQSTVVPDRSYLVKIEHKELDDPSLAETNLAAPAATAAPDLKPGMGALRSLGN